MNELFKKAIEAYEAQRRVEMNKLENQVSAPRTEIPYYPGRTFDGPGEGGMFTNQRPQTMDQRMQLDQLRAAVPAMVPWLQMSKEQTK